jgi:hypothetical protein
MSVETTSPRGEPSPADELRDAIATGRPVRRGDGEPAADGAAWGEQRTLPADVLYELLAGSSAGTTPRAAVLVGLRITGRLNLEAAELRAPLIAHGCHFDEPANLIGAIAPEIRLTACSIPALAADRLETRGDLDLTASVLQVVRLRNAHVGGELTLDGVELLGGDPPDLGDGAVHPLERRATSAAGMVLVAGAMRVDGTMSCRNGFVAHGLVDLTVAHIGGQLSLHDARLEGGLAADGLRVDVGMWFVRVEAKATIRLLSARIAGQLSMRATTLAEGMIADGLRVEGAMFCDDRFVAEGPVRLIGAHVAGPLTLKDATFAKGIHADRLRVEGGMFCHEGFEARDEVRLLAAHVGGQILCRGASFGGGLAADGIRVVDDMFCDGDFTSAKDVRLLGAHIGGQLSFNGAKLAGDLTADGMRVEGGMFCGEGCTVEGVVRLVAASVKVQLSFSDATLVGGMLADRLHVAGNMFCQVGFRSTGPIRLLAAHVTQQLSFGEGTLACPEGLALDLEGARIDGDLGLQFAERPLGGVDLTGVTVGRLFDSESTWPRSLRLAGCSYRQAHAAEDASRPPDADAPLRRLWRGMRPAPPPDVQRRLRWIRLAEEESVAPASGESPASAPIAPRGSRFAPQPYTELMALYRREGRDGDVRYVAYERERRRSGQLRPLGKAWNAFLRWTVGYGYKPLRALGLLFALVIVGSWVFSSFHDDGRLVALRSEHPPFVAGIYTLDRLVPVVSFGLRDAFAPRGAAQWWAFAYTLLGWALTVAVLAGLNAAVRRD